MEKVIILLEKHIWKNLCYIVTFVLQFFHVVGCLKFNNKAPVSIQICIGFEDAITRPKILDNRLDILTQILIIMNYFFFCIFQRSTFNLEKNKNIGWGKFLVHFIQLTGYWISDILNFLCLYRSIFSGARYQRKLNSSESLLVHMGCSRTRTNSYWNTCPEF